MSIKRKLVVTVLVWGWALAACNRGTPAPATSAPTSEAAPTTVATAAPTTAAQSATATAAPPATQPSDGYPAAVASPALVEPTAEGGYPAGQPTGLPTAEASLPTEAPAIIMYRDFEISPAETRIKVGTEVVFLISGSLHQPYNFDAPNVFEAPNNLGDGSLYTYTFNEVGTTTISCGYHPDTMKATVIVEP